MVEVMAARDPSDEVGIELEALAFVAGFVACKCRAIDPTLGQVASIAQPSSVPDSWLRVVSRGGLLVPSERWMAVVQGFELTFNLVIGRAADDQPGIVRRLMAELLLAIIGERIA